MTIPRKKNYSRSDKSFNLRQRVRNLLEKKGHRVACIGGTALETMTVAGLFNLTSSEPSQYLRAEMALEFQRQLVHYGHDWTMVHCLVDFKEDEDGDMVPTIRSKAWHVLDQKAGQLDDTTTAQTLKRFEEEHNEFTVGHIWILSPCKMDLGKAEDLLDEFDDFLEDVKFFDYNHMTSRRDALRLEGVIERSKKDDDFEGDTTCITEHS